MNARNMPKTKKNHTFNSQMLIVIDSRELAVQEIISIDFLINLTNVEDLMKRIIFKESQYQDLFSMKKIM